MKYSFEPYLTCLPLLHQGKVRDSFGGTTTEGTFLVVATDRLSTHDVVHRSLIPDKGYILTAMTIFWIQEILGDIEHHVVAYGLDIYNHLPENKDYPVDLHLRGLIVKKLDMIPYELIFRSYLTGSLWDKFVSKGLANPYGIEVDEGMGLMSPFTPIAFTPTEKSATDDPVSSEMMRQQYPEAVFLARQVYHSGRAYALQRGIDIIDFKCEVGMHDREYVLADEWLTPDCCRFVRSEDIVLGKNPPWLDKQVFRDYAVSEWKRLQETPLGVQDVPGNTKPPLEFPEEIILQGAGTYHDVFETLTGYMLVAFQSAYLEN